MGGLMAIRKASPVRAWRADPGLAQNAVPVFRASASARQHRTRGTGAPQHSASGRAVITRGVPADSTRAISRASPTPPTGERRLCPLAHGTASNSARGPIAAKFGPGRRRDQAPGHDLDARRNGETARPVAAATSARAVCHAAKRGADTGRETSNQRAGVQF